MNILNNLRLILFAILSVCFLTDNLYSTDRQEEADNHKNIVIVVHAQNEAEWYTKNLDSIINQSYAPDHVRVVYIANEPNDGTPILVHQYINKHNLADKVTLIISREGGSKSENMQWLMHTFDPHDILVQMDGDNWFMSRDFLSNLVQAYQNPAVLSTYFPGTPSITSSYAFVLRRQLNSKNETISDEEN